ncbi:hypothetical protein NDN17_14430 [Shewanella algae]|uniref:hypothetical protein n=1 Tax=Shewanella algae TaxID=38313 RepID=UPI002034DFC3|nr:hypothetical protein [Shewanella algae]MCM2529698.1 hypothetical protein [Shewanella algae]
MSHQNSFDPIMVDNIEYPIEHLKGLQLILTVIFGNKDSRDIEINVRPTNHLYSRAVVNEDHSNKESLVNSGHWLVSYEHSLGNYQNVKNPQKVKENRIFCTSKWEQSHLLPTFINLIKQNPKEITVLANDGDTKTCMSAILNIEDQPDEIYVVFFILTKVNSKELNMLIESGYCLRKDDNRKAPRILSKNKHVDRKPFIVVVKNVMEGRLPFENQQQNKRRGKQKQKKQKQK